MSAVNFDDGEMLGIPRALQIRIGDEWRSFVADMGFEFVAIEATVVNDHLMVAGTTDRVARCTKRLETSVGIALEVGDLVTIDIKTGSKIVKPAYAAQLAAYADAIPYDVDTDERSEWPGKVRADVAIIAHYPCNASLKGEDVGWSAIPVALADGRRIDDEIHALRSSDVKSSFGEPVDPPTIAAPVAYPAVERPATDTGTHGTAPVSVANLDEQRARYKALPEGDKAAVARYWEANDVDLTDADAIAESIDAVHNYRDVVTEPVTRPAPVVPPAVAPDPDEGPDVPADIADELQADYKALDPAARSWIAAIAKDARPSVSMKERPTARRYGIVAGLVLLSDGLDNDDAVRACIAEAIGNELAHSMALSVGALVGSMNATEADTFRDAAYSLAKDGRGMAFTPGPVLSPKEAA